MGCCKEQHTGGSGPGDCIAAVLICRWASCGSLNFHVALESPAVEPTEFGGGHTDNPIYDPYNKLVPFEAGGVLV